MELSYSKLHNATLEKLPDSPINVPIIRELLSDCFDPGLVSLDPYHELLPSYYSFHQKGIPHSDRAMSAGVKHTTRLLHTIQRNGNIQLLPDLIIASCLHDILKLRQTLPEPLPDIFLHEAKKHLSENNYPLWHHTTKKYLPAIPNVALPEATDTLIATDTYLISLSQTLILVFSEAFLQYDIIYHGHTENCYRKAEEYKLSLLSKYFS